MNRGTLRINGNNVNWGPDAGARTVTINDDGLLIVGHDNALGTAGTVTVNNGGNLQIADGVTFSRPVTFNAGATFSGSGSYNRGTDLSLAGVAISPGNSIGTLTIEGGDAVTLDQNTSFLIELAGDGSSDLFRVVDFGTLTLGDANIFISGTAQLGHWYTIIEAEGAIFGEFGTIDISGLGDPNLTFDTRFSGAGDEFQIQIIPEPATYVALMGMAALLFCLYRRRIKVAPKA